MDALLNRVAAAQLTGLLAAAMGAFVLYVIGVDTALLPVTTMLLVLAALVVAFVRRWWASAAGLGVALFTVGEFVVNGTAAHLFAAAGPGDHAGALGLAAGLAVSLAAGVAAVVGHCRRTARPIPGAEPGGVQQTMKKKRRIALKVSAGLAALLVLTAGGYTARNVTYAAWDADRVERAGFVEKQVDVNGSTLNYAEGPDNGPPLLLIHGQLTDWQSWSRVLPELSQRFHVYAVDCYGHGRSARVPEKYTANALTDDLAQFLREAVGEPAMIAGHSSGGLVAAGLAADAPDQVQGVILEDPPFFSSVLPRAQQTFNHVGLATNSHNFLRSGETDFTTYYLRHSAMWDLFGGVGDWIRNHALSYRADHPTEPVRLSFMPPAMNEAFRGVPSYDPRFGETFYDNSFHQDFDHADVLARIAVPAVLIHTNWTYHNGILLAAMDGEDAERARSLIPDVEFYKVDTGHCFHFEDAGHFTRIALGFKDRVDG